MNNNRNFRFANLLIILNTLFLFSFVQDSSKLNVFAIKKTSDLHNIFKYRGEKPHFVSAHRGGPLPGFPENCIPTFENTLKNTFAIMEIDPRYTKDSLMVLHHDPALGRTVDGKGLVINYTLAELQKMNLKDSKGNITDLHMPTFDEALEWAKGRTVLVIDQKDVSAKDRLRKAEEHNCVQNVILIVYSFDDAKLCYSLNKDIMMEVMIPSVEKVLEFDKTGIPWKNVVAFVGHQVPEDPELFRMIHQRGALCMAGSSRNVDLKYLRGLTSDITTLESEYLNFFAKGVDIIETDIPVQMGPLVNPGLPVKSAVKKYYKQKTF
jgi:glycerophosphoryl diester phosphodiesterase